jgi:hypothetical protein
VRVDRFWWGRIKWGLLRFSRRTIDQAETRLRTRGRSALARAARMTGATVAAFVVAEVIGLREPPPLIAALTALLVVQATLAGTLVNGIQRVFSVVAGVALAVLFVSVVGLTWWSLGALVAASIVVGQLLRLGPHVVEVPISAMLVLGVGHAGGAESIGAGRVVETLIGAVVGVLVNVAFPPAVRTGHVSGAVAAFADEIAALLAAAADALGRGPVTVDQANRWLEDARRLNRHSSRLDRALVDAEESRLLNLRALGHPLEGGLRTNLDALEHSSVSMRALFRALYDATQRRTGVQDDPDYATSVRCSVAVLMGDMATVFRTFGRCISGSGDGTAQEKHAELASALQALHHRRDTLESVLIGDPRIRQGLWDLNSTLLTTVDRLLAELDTTAISPDLDRRRAAQALAKLRAAVHDGTHRSGPRASRGEEPPEPPEHP